MCVVFSCTCLVVINFTVARPLWVLNDFWETFAHFMQYKIHVSSRLLSRLIMCLHMTPWDMFFVVPCSKLMVSLLQVPHEFGVLRVFGFNSTVQRMSVVVRQLVKPHMELYCKGAPEVIVRLSDPKTGRAKLQFTGCICVLASVYLIYI